MGGRTIGRIRGLWSTDRPVMGRAGPPDSPRAPPDSDARGHTGPATSPTVPVRRSRDRFPVDSRCRTPFQSTERSLKRIDLDVMQQRCESSPLVSARCLVDSRERWRQELPALRPVLRPLTESVLRPAPSLHAPRLLRRFISTMSRSDSRPRLDSPLRSSLVTNPHRRRRRRTRSGLPGPDDDL